MLTPKWPVMVPVLVTVLCEVSEMPKFPAVNVPLLVSVHGEALLP